jgi:hypothetical protein
LPRPELFIFFLSAIRYAQAMRMSARILGGVLLLLSVVTGLVWYAALSEDHRGILSVTFLDVGQGIAVFVEALQVSGSSSTAGPMIRY